jgi:hypothetical protein
LFTDISSPTGILDGYKKERRGMIANDPRRSQPSPAAPTRSRCGAAALRGRTVRRRRPPRRRLHRPPAAARALAAPPAGAPRGGARARTAGCRRPGRCLHPAYSLGLMRPRLQIERGESTRHTNLILDLRAP